MGTAEALMIHFELDNLLTDETAPLHSVLAWHEVPKMAYIELSECNVLTASCCAKAVCPIPARIPSDIDVQWLVRPDAYCCAVGCTTPIGATSNLDLRWPVRPDLRGIELADLLKGDAHPLLDRIVAGRSSEMQGDVRQGILNADAQRAYVLMQAFLDNLGSDCDAVWDVHDWAATGNGHMVHWAYAKKQAAYEPEEDVGLLC